VVVDTRAYENSRKTTAFVGGLDLCDGRYDTPEHRLFRDRDTVFKNDYLNPTLLVSILIHHLKFLNEVILYIYCQILKIKSYLMK